MGERKIKALSRLTMGYECARDGERRGWSWRVRKVGKDMAERRDKGR